MTKLNSRNFWPWYCKGCGTNTKAREDQWWDLRNYHGLTGVFCPDCYEKIQDPKQRVILHLQLENG